jgi:hypothetical protein
MVFFFTLDLGFKIVTLPLRWRCHRCQPSGNSTLLSSYLSTLCLRRVLVKDKLLVKGLKLLSLYNFPHLFNLAFQCCFGKMCFLYPCHVILRNTESKA